MLNPAANLSKGISSIKSSHDIKGAFDGRWRACDHFPSFYRDEGQTGAKVIELVNGIAQMFPGQTFQGPASVM